MLKFDTKVTIYLFHQKQTLLFLFLFRFGWNLFPF